MVSDRLVIPTKLKPPPYRETWVGRAHLVERLGLPPDQRLTLIVAPAGFGKSTLAAQWLLSASRGRNGSSLGSHWPRHPVAWLTLDEHDQDALRLLTYLAGAVEHVAPGALPATLDLLNAPRPVPLYALLEAFLVELDALPDGLTLVLDDYHWLTSEPVHQLVAYLLRHLPRACRLVLISRTDPPLPLARLRAERQFADLRATDLRFTPAETVALLTALEGTPPDPARAAALHQQTEGWPIALHLAALAQADGRIVEAMPGQARRQIAEYLAEEVLARQPANLQAALPALAVPERFCAGLAAALLDAPAHVGERLLERLEAANLFLIPLDGEGRWYRFHALFRDLLQRRLRQTDDGSRERTLQRRAADWLAADGQVEEAVRLYLAAGAEDAAAHLMEQALAREMGRDVIAAPAGYLLRLLPLELIHRRLGLTLLEARLEAILLNASALAASLDRVDALLAKPEYAAAPPPWPNFFGDLAVLRGTLRYLQGRPAEAIALMQDALALQPVPALVGQALLIMGRAYAADGRYDEGVRHIRQELAAPTVKGNPQHAVHCYAGLCTLHASLGSIADLERDAAKLADVGMALRPSESYYAYVHSNLARAAYERSRLEAAARHFGLIAQHRYYATTLIALGALTGLGMIAAIQGDLATAEVWKREIWDFAHELGTPYARQQALALAAWLALRHNNRSTALRFARAIEPDIHIGAYGWFAMQPPLIIRAQILIAAGDREDLAQAEMLLEHLRAEAEALLNIRPLVAILACQALFFQVCGQHREARRSIERAVELAAPRGYLRTFVDVGPAIRPLLQSLAGEGIATAYLRPILAALESSAVERQGHIAGPAQRPRLPDALSRREREILALLAERWSNQEIAERLHIALNTVRKHTSTIYNKLGVGSRREAVAVGRTLGLLPGE